MKSLSETTNAKLIEIIEKNAVDKDLLFAIYQSELNFKSKLLELENTKQIQKIRANTEKEIALINMGFMLEEHNEE